MLRTRVIEIDVLGWPVRLTVVDNADEIYMDSLYQEETPVWVDVWPAALALARWIKINSPLFEGKTVLELGAGLGLPGLVAAIAGAREVVQTDYVEEAVRLARQSAHLNNLSQVRNVVADWRSFPLTEQFDLIIGSDFLYLPATFPYLKKIFASSLAPGGKLVIADPGRFDSLRLLQEMKEEGWHWEEDIIPVRQGNYSYDIHIFQGSRACANSAPGISADR